MIIAVFQLDKRGFPITVHHADLRAAVWEALIVRLNDMLKAHLPLAFDRVTLQASPSRDIAAFFYEQNHMSTLAKCRWFDPLSQPDYCLSKWCHDIANQWLSSQGYPQLPDEPGNHLPRRIEGTRSGAGDASNLSTETGDA